MNTNVPYMPSVKNLHDILNAMTNAAVPEAFGNSFLVDLGFTSSNDRPVLKLLKYLGFLDDSGRPQTPYREFVNNKISKSVMATQVAKSYDDLFKTNPDADTKSATDLKGWFKTKTGESDAVAKKMATTFKSLCDYSDFTSVDKKNPTKTPTAPNEKPEDAPKDDPRQPNETPSQSETNKLGTFGLVYRFEIHLPDTQNVDTYRAIFKAMREELSQ
jgi:hypothetical protein